MIFIVCHIMLQYIYEDDNKIIKRIKTFFINYMISFFLYNISGITVKAQTASMIYEDERDGGKRYLINLIDTPGHIDFSYEGKIIVTCFFALKILLLQKKLLYSLLTLTFFLPFFPSSFHHSVLPSFPSFLSSFLPFLPSFLSSYLSSFLPFFFSSFLPFIFPSLLIFLSSFHPYLVSFLPSFFHSFLPFFLPLLSCPLSLSALLSFFPLSYFPYTYFFSFSYCHLYISLLHLSHLVCLNHSSSGPKSRIMPRGFTSR